ncbi:MAG: cytochrome c biogenesis protein ResB [Chloroflexi bacterium]|nr:cytochrome c biogenesis protein ResB [Chloroflexota bacterium]
MAAGPRPAAPAMRSGGLDPLRWVWQLLCNVKFALFLVGLASVAGLIGVVIGQVPRSIRSNPAGRSVWFNMQRDEFGVFTEPMRRLGLFEVFYSPWFNALWALIIIAVTVCTVSRLRPTIRSVRRPTREVGERYFETAHHRADFTHPGGATAVEQALRRRRYTVTRTRSDGEATYLFAQRFAWSQYGTFLSHLALLMLLIGGLLTRLVGFDAMIVLAEGTPAYPVFKTPGSSQMFIRMLDAYRGQDAAGNITDFHSDIEVTRGGKTITCKATVNTPCQAFGYRIHQAAFFDDTARLRVSDASGQIVYDGMFDFQSQKTAVPVLKVTDTAGRELFNQELPQMGTDPGAAPGREDDLALAPLTFPRAPGAAASDLVTYLASWRIEGNNLRVSIQGDTGAPRTLTPGREALIGLYRVTYVGPRLIPAITVKDMPGAPNGAVLQMATDASGGPYLLVSGIGDDNTKLVPGEALGAPNGYTYTFGARVDASGVSVKRDPGDTFIWVAVAMALIGLSITFYVPRRRLWVKVTASRTYVAGVAERTTRLSRELRLMGAALGSKDALRPEDTEEG